MYDCMIYELGYLSVFVFLFFTGESQIAQSIYAFLPSGLGLAFFLFYFLFYFLFSFERDGKWHKIHAQLASNGSM